MWMKRVRVRLGLPVSYARTPSGNAPLNALARLILSPNPSEPHTLKNTEHCQKYLPAWMVFERQTFVDPILNELVVDILYTPCWHSAVRLAIFEAILLYFNSANLQHYWRLYRFCLIAWDDKIWNFERRLFQRLNSRTVSNLWHWE